LIFPAPSSYRPTWLTRAKRSLSTQ
jgi:hypothetical protein